MTATEPLPPLRVLIVEDNSDCALSSAMLLRMEGHDVRIAQNGAEALAIISTFAADAALIDIMMPGMDGYEVARQLRLRNGAHPLLLVAVTGLGQEQDRRRSAEAGFDQHFLKPVAPPILVEALRQFQNRVIRTSAPEPRKSPLLSESAAR